MADVDPAVAARAVDGTVLVRGALPDGPAAKPLLGDARDTSRCLERFMPGAGYLGLLPRGEEPGSEADEDGVG